MIYRSTRGLAPAKTFSEAVLEGLAEDGGLLVPDSLPDFSGQLGQLAGLEYPALAARLLTPLATDMPAQLVASCCERAYGPRYGGPVAPLVRWGDRYVLELIHGPTLAFKDVALQLLGQLFEVILEQRQQRLNIVAATSGDTGSAAIYGVLGCPRVSLFVTHPKGRIAELQRLQMSTVLQPNIFNLAVDGSFDDCQNMVKELAGDLEFKRRYSIGAVNSINWARIAAQIVYYFAAYLQTPGAARRRPVVMAVPTGNFGNILAAEYARRMGLPIAELVLASNENDILPTFFRTGVYRRGEARQTHSPAMDIQVSSNFERYLHMLADGDGEKVRLQMETFQRTGALELAPVSRGWSAFACSNQDTVQTVLQVHKQHGRVLDPHSATAWWALSQRQPELDPELDRIVVATAHPAKFPEVLQRALPAGTEGLTHPALEALRAKPERLFELAASSQDLKTFVATHVSDQEGTCSQSQGGVFSSLEEKAR
jgi:threonine synthase